MTVTTFSELELDESLLEALQDKGFTRPTAIQAAAIPPALDGRDVLGSAPTGTGKTAAYLLPALQHLLDFPRKKSGPPRILILTPTRELAMQVADHARELAKHTHLDIATITGGVAYMNHAEVFSENQDIVVATTGRLLQYIKEENFDCRAVETLILDEADRMLDMGFIHDIKRILKLLPARRQTLFFSATMPPEIETLANSMLTKPEKVEVTPASSTVDIISQQVYFVEKKEKKDLLIHLLKDTSIESVLIFTRTKYGADKLARVLTKAGIGAEAIHGNKTQNARQRALTNFKNHTLRALIATDIAARGIDVDQLSHVINYELPNVPETYVHRIGRTGRAGHEGVAISFCESEELPYLKDIQKLIGKNIPVVKDHPFVTTEGIKAQEEKQEEIKVKAKANKTYRGSRANGDFWRRKKQKTNQPSSTKQEKRK